MPDPGSLVQASLLVTEALFRAEEAPEGMCEAIGTPARLRQLMGQTPS